MDLYRPQSYPVPQDYLGTICQYATKHCPASVTWDHSQPNELNGHHWPHLGWHLMSAAEKECDSLTGWILTKAPNLDQLATSPQPLPSHIKLHHLAYLLSSTYPPSDASKMLGNPTSGSLQLSMCTFWLVCIQLLLELSCRKGLTPPSERNPGRFPTLGMLSHDFVVLVVPVEFFCGR